MQSSFSVAFSAQLSLQKRLETISNNVANASTAGFRAEEVGAARASGFQNRDEGVNAQRRWKYKGPRGKRGQARP